MSQFAITACLVLSLMTVGHSAAVGGGGVINMNRKILYIEEESTESAVVTNDALPVWLREHVSSTDDGQGTQKRKLDPAELLEGMKKLRTASGIEERVHGTTRLSTVIHQPSPVLSTLSSREPPTSPPEPLAPARDDPIEPKSAPKSAPTEPPEMPPEETTSPDVAPVDSPVPPPAESEDVVVVASPSEMQIDPAPPLLEPQETPAVASEVPPSELLPEEQPLPTPAEAPPSPADAPEPTAPAQAPEPTASIIIFPQASPAPAPAEEPQSSISSLQEFRCGTSGGCGETELRTKPESTQGPAKTDAPGLIPSLILFSRLHSRQRVFVEPPKQLSSQVAEESAVRIQADTAAAVEQHKGGSHIGHSVKVASWTLGGVCLLLVAIGNVLGIYYSRNRRRHALLPTDDL